MWTEYYAHWIKFWFWIWNPTNECWLWQWKILFLTAKFIFISNFFFFCLLFSDQVFLHKRMIRCLRTQECRKKKNDWKYISWYSLWFFLFFLFFFFFLSFLHIFQKNVFCVSVWFLFLFFFFFLVPKGKYLYFATYKVVEESMTMMIVCLSVCCVCLS